MSTIEQRASRRVACDVPLRLVTDIRHVDARALDLSRTGIRLRVPGRVLGVHRLSSLVQIAKRVSSLLGDTFVAEMHPERLGGLVRKTLHLVRIGQRNWESADVDLGCRLREWVTDDEASMMGLPLPRVGEDGLPGDVADQPPSPRAPDASTDEEREPRGQPRLRAYVYAGDARGQTPLTADALELGSEHAVLEIPDIRALGLELPPRPDVSTFVMALDAAYGDALTVRVVDGARDVHTGSISLREVEVAGEDLLRARIRVQLDQPVREAVLATLSS